MSMSARWTVECDGVAWLPDHRCNSIVRGQDSETPADLHRRALAERRWTHDVRTGRHFCKAKHLDVGGGDTTP